MAVGGGSGLQLNRDSSHHDFAGSLTYSLGVGSSPLKPLVLGGLLRGQTFFGLGTDLGLAIRAATGGFARGDWGVALDAGVLWRPWGNGDYGEWPIQGVLTVGAPWGLQLALGAEVSSVSGGTPAQGFFAALEIRSAEAHRDPSGLDGALVAEPRPGGRAPERLEPRGRRTPRGRLVARPLVVGPFAAARRGEVYAPSAPSRAPPSELASGAASPPPSGAPSGTASASVLSGGASVASGRSMTPPPPALP